jgi:hypothetical protein
MIEMMKRTYKEGQIDRLLIGTKDFGGSFYEFVFEAWCHSNLMKGGTFSLENISFNGRRTANGQIILQSMEECRFSGRD